MRSTRQLVSTLHVFLFIVFLLGRLGVYASGPTVSLSKLSLQSFTYKHQTSLFFTATNTLAYFVFASVRKAKKFYNIDA